MSDRASRSPRALLSRGGWILFVLLWAVGAALSARVGFWKSLGSFALVLAALALLLEPALWRTLHPISGKALMLGALVGLLMAVAVWTLYGPVVAAVPWMAGDKARLYDAFAALTVPQAALALPLVITGEELVWRGLVHESLARRLRPTTAALAGAALYGAATIPSGSPTLALTAWACGLVWSFLRMYSGAVVVPLVSHLVWATLVLFVWPVG